MACSNPLRHDIDPFRPVLDELVPSRLQLAHALADMVAVAGLPVAIESLIGVSQIQASVRSITSANVEFATAANDLGRRIYESLIEPLAPLLDRLRHKFVREAFTAAQFIPSRFLDDIRVAVVRAHEEGADAATLGQMIETFLDEDNCKRLEVLVEGLCSSAEFAGRDPVLRESLAAHRAGLNATSAYPLAAMIEGIIMPLFQELYPTEASRIKMTAYHRHLTYLLEGVPDRIVENIGTAACETLIAFLEAHFYRFSTWSGETTVAAMQGGLNRHSLLHGRARQGTRRQTLQLFVMLEVLSEMLPALRLAASHNPHSNKIATNLKKPKCAVKQNSLITA